MFGTNSRRDSGVVRQDGVGISYVEDVVLVRIVKGTEVALFVGRRGLLFTLLCLMSV